MDGLLEYDATHTSDAIWVIVDRLTKVARFMPMKNTWGAKQLADVYVREIVRIHGVPRTTVSDRDQKSFYQGYGKSSRKLLGVSCA